MRHLPILFIALAATAAAQDPPAAVVLDDLGGVEAPAQPVGTSSSAYDLTGRSTPEGRSGSFGRIETPVSSLVAVRGQEDNVLTGIGLVDGLAGTGDSGELAKQLLQNLLLTRDINVDRQALSSKNLAVVRVEAVLPAGIKPGRRIDARVSTIGDAKSLVGGTLVMTELTDLAGDYVYATAGGALNVGGFQAEGESASATKNHVTVGVLPQGAIVQREVATRLVTEHGYIYLDLRWQQGSFGNLVRITESINDLFPGAATAAGDGQTVRVRVPEDLPSSAHIAYLDTILKQEVESDNMARVVVNERTGVIVMGGNVRLRPGAIAHGSLIVTISESEEASQPGPFSDGTTERLDRTDLAVQEENNGLVLLPGAVTLQEVVDVLNVLGATPRDMISILGAMSDGGLLVAEIRRL